MNKRRVLIIDDNESIHRDFRDVLGSRNRMNLSLDELASVLFGEATTSPERGEIGEGFQLDCAASGEEGVRIFAEAHKACDPHLVAFVDMCMPGGWDGIRTIEELWKVSGDVRIVVCTAYMERYQTEIANRLAQRKKLLVRKKPFDGLEIAVLTAALCEEDCNLEMMV